MSGYEGELTDQNIREIFKGADDFVYRTVRCGQLELMVYMIDGLTSGSEIAETVLKPLIELGNAPNMEMLYQKCLCGIVYNAVVSPCADLKTTAMKLVNGFCAVLFPGIGVIAFEVKSGQRRNPETPDVENTVKGAKDGFVETMRTNTCLVRRHLRTPQLRFFQTTIGRRSLTNVTVSWIEGITNQDYVERMKRRLNEIDIDGLISPAAVEEYISGSRATAFPLLQYTERTDKFCHGLLEGRVGLIVDGLPIGYLAPVDLAYLMDSPEDRAKGYVISSCVRVLRYAALIIGLILPGLGITISTFHQALIPLPLLRAIIESKQFVPFSTMSEILGLLIAFELLEESGIHVPKSIGQSISIIGGIVVGSAAVEAKLISPLALITVSVTGICGFVLPDRDLADGIRTWRFFIAVLSAISGIYGLIGGVLILLMHLMGLKSLGIPYLSTRNMEVVRRRLKFGKHRNSILKPEDRRRQK